LATQLPYNGAVLILALDTSSNAGSLAVLRDEKLIGLVSTLGQETYSSRMFRHLEFLLRDLSLKLEQFDLFAVSAGPGSFTGLRVGLTAAKGWAEVYNKPVVGVSVLEAIAAQSNSAAAVLVPAFDARRGEVYFGVYRRGKHLLAREGEECVLRPEDFFRTLAERPGSSEFAIISPTPEAFAAELSRIEQEHLPVPHVERVSSVLAPLIGQLGYQRAQHGQVSDALTLDANYVRRTDAEVYAKRQ
jgi:tRNA threonylcarbamoyladenosine biosynthesis protein TsaB